MQRFSTLIFLAFFFVLSFLVSYSANASENDQFTKGTLFILYDNLESNTGKVVVKLYDTSSPKFPDTQSAIFIKTVKIKQGQAKVVFKDLPLGLYAFSTFHDENENNRMDTNRFYFPKEGYAFSNNLKIVFGPPSFEKASFELKQKNQIVHVKLSY